MPILKNQIANIRSSYIRRKGEYLTAYRLVLKYIGHQTRIPLCSSCDNTLSSCSTEHIQVYFVLQKELLQAGMLELDTLFPFLSTLDNLKFLQKLDP